MLTSELGFNIISQFAATHGFNEFKCMYVCLPVMHDGLYIFENFRQPIRSRSVF